MNLTENSRQTVLIYLSVDGEGLGCLTQVVQGPEGSEPLRERSGDKVIVTVSVGLVLRCGIVSAGVGGIIWRILFLATIFIWNPFSNKSSKLPKCYEIFLPSAVVPLLKYNFTAFRKMFIFVDHSLRETRNSVNSLIYKKVWNNLYNVSNENVVPFSFAITLESSVISC